MLARRRTALRYAVGGVAALGATATGTVALLPYDSPVRRSVRTGVALGRITAGYKWLEWSGHNDDAPRVSRQHANAAAIALSLCERQGGMFAKLGQHLAALGRGLPQEYVDALSRLQDRAPTHDFADVRRTIEAELHTPLEALFAEFDATPIASASLAQVHRARLKATAETATGEAEPVVPEEAAMGDEVAVKVQHPRVKRSVESDLRTLDFIVLRFVPFIFPDVQLAWILPDFSDNLRRELNFVSEANNAERATATFHAYKSVKIPKVYRDLSSEKVLVMEFMRGVRITDAASLSPAVDPKRVASLLAQAFAEMIFTSGFVHCDAHPGNLLVAANPQSPNGFDLIILDHGFYRELDDAFRLAYCRLWVAMLSCDMAGLQRAVEDLGMPGFAEMFTLMLMRRPLSRLEGGEVRRELSEEERQRLKSMSKGMTPADGVRIVESLPRDLLFVMRTNNLVRALCKRLGAAEQSWDSILRSALGGLRAHDGGSSARYWFTWVRWQLSMLALRVLQAAVRLRASMSLYFGQRTGVAPPPLQPAAPTPSA